jgi:hypothetical protein
MKLVYVKWEDPFSHDPWTNIPELVKMLSEPCICETIGYIVHETRKYIIIANTHNSERQVCGSIRIPKGCIKEKRIISDKV